jgi:Fe-S-cluster containining protein
VAASAAEVLAIVTHLRRTLSPPELQALAARVEELDERRREAGPDGRARQRFACPLLRDERCSVYEVRPLSCRGCNSYDARACERHYFTGRGTLPIYNAQHEIHSSVLAGLVFGLRDAGLEAEPLELVAALRAALARPDLERRWLKGEAAWNGAHFAEALPEVYEDVVGGSVDGKSRS